MSTGTDLHELRQILSKDPEDPVLATDPRSWFYPTEAHRAALDPSTLVVVGERGEGKSALFRFLGWLSENDVPASEIWAPRSAGERVVPSHWMEAFGEVAGHQESPSVEVVEAFVADADEGLVRTFWWGAAARCLAGVFPDVAPVAVLNPADQRFRYQPAAWAADVRVQVGAVSEWLDRLEQRLAAEGRVAVLTYDSLDRLGAIRVRKLAVGALLSAWLGLQNRYRFIAAKIFLRPDLLDSALEAFPDASKLLSRRQELRWEREDLFGLLARVMAARNDALLQYLKAPQHHAETVSGAKRMGIAFTSHRVLGLLPDREDVRDQAPPLEQRVTFALAGRVIGKGPAKQRPAMWIGSQLADARGRIVPRSLLLLVTEAAKAAVLGGDGGEPLLTLPNLEAGLRTASEQRLREMTEDHPVVARLRRAGPIDLPADSLELRRRVAFVPNGGRDDGFADDGAAVVRELERLGVLEVRTDRRIDVPEIYRVALRFDRRGARRGASPSG